MNTKFATLYNKLSQEREELFKTNNKEESMTQQSDKDSTDINIIMARFEKTGQLPQVNVQGIHGDFTGITDFHDAQQRILAAKEAFEEIPATIRDRFNNDPVEFVKFAENPDNIDALREMGLATPSPQQENDNTTSPMATPSYPYYGDNDNGTEERQSRTIRTGDVLRDREIESTRGTREGAPEGRTALRQPEAVRTPGAGESRPGGRLPAGR